MKKMINIPGLKISEHEIQCSIVQWARLKKLTMLIAIPNGGLRNIIVAKKLKMEGVVSGVSDLFFAYPMNGFHGLWIEVKTKNGKLSSSQDLWIKNMKFFGYKAEGVRSVNEGINLISDYILEK
jgi:hypothetical protein